MLRRRYGILKKALLASAFFIVCTQVQAACLPSGPHSRVDVDRVLDGDTLVLLDGRHVRLIGINTPELGRDGRADEPFARAARDSLQRLAAPGTRLQLYEGRESRDRYGRTLAHLVGADGRLLAESLIAGGLGFAVAIVPNAQLADCLFSVERRARERRRGIWRRSPVVRLDDGAVLQRGFGLWQGRVSRAGGHADGAWVVLDERVFVSLPVSFRDGVGKLRGRRLQVRGWLVDRGDGGGRQRWLLSISHPLHLRFVD